MIIAILPEACMRRWVVFFRVSLSFIVETVLSNIINGQPYVASFHHTWKVLFHCGFLGLYSLRRRRLISKGIPIINLRRSSDRLRFKMGIPIPERRCLLSEKRPWCHVASLWSTQGSAFGSGNGWEHQAISWSNVNIPSMSSVAFTWEQYPRMYSWYQSTCVAWQLPF